MKKLTVAEYAELNCITVQAVYKKINKLNSVEEERNGRKITLIIVEDEEEKEKEADNKPISTSNSTSTASTSTPDNIGNSTSNSTSTASTSTPELNPNSTDNSTSSIIEVLRIQLQEKDKQIERLQSAAEEKDKQIKEQFERLTALLARSQELEAITHRLLGEGEPAEAEEDNIDIVADNQPEDEEQEPQKKKGFFSRLFKRKKGGE